MSLLSRQPEQRLRVRIRGRVQGVGFRPFIWGLARTHGLTGWVRNDRDGVLTEVQGSSCLGFIEEIRAKAPALSRIDSIECEPVVARGEVSFEIARSIEAEGARSLTIPPDVTICDDCLVDLFGGDARRDGYAFVNCTHCGPRFTIARGLPYDRAATSMAGFVMCDDCAREYADPSDRRYHAQPNACARCGPHMSLSADAIVRRLQAGEILAIKGLGGFHIACDARNEATLARLRAVKYRPAKPLAVMVLNVASARALADVSNAEARLLESAARPIVVVDSRNALPAAVTSGLSSLGLLLPYTPVHYMLFHEAAGRPAGRSWLGEPNALALVMTSANPAGLPLVKDDAEAAERLAGLADAVAGHDREIVTRCDDSVVRIVGNAPVLLRRSRGYVPDTVELAEDGPCVLATGAFLKTTACLLHGREALLSQHIGDAENKETWTFLAEAITHLEEMAGVSPERIACDLHPDYLSTRFAEDTGLPVHRVQHHHAHLAAVAAEYRLTGPLTGLVLDGFGLGDDGTMWGGELLRMEGAGFDRLGHLAPLPLPGGDRAAREPWRMAAAVLDRLGRKREIGLRFGGSCGTSFARLLGSGLSYPSTTSCGRLFDAAAALLGICTENRFEGEAAMRLEGLCRKARSLDGGWHLNEGVLDFAPLLDRLASTSDAVEGSELFHGTLASGLAALALAGLPEGERRLAVTGGCAVNRPLVECLHDHLQSVGIELLIPRQAPPGDGGLSLGQALVARRQLMESQ